jgi:hypothetical protein
MGSSSKCPLQLKETIKRFGRRVNVDPGAADRYFDAPRLFFGSVP